MRMGNSTKKIMDAVQNGAGSAAAGAGKAKEFLFEKSRAGLDKAYQTKKKLAVANVTKLRTQNATSKPQGIIDLLEAELKSEEMHSGTNTEAFASAVALYVFSVIEVHGENPANAAARQRLIDALVVVDSKTAKNIAKYGGIAVAIFSKRLRVIGGAVAALATLRSRAPWLKRGLVILGIKNPGKKVASFAVIAATNKTLGPAPKTWPAAKAQSKKPVE